MKRLACLLSGLGLFAAGAHADDKVEIKNDRDHKLVERKHKNGKYEHKTKVESKSRHRLGGGRVDTTETTVEGGRRGHEGKRKMTETVERDDHGNVIRHEKKLDK